MKGEGWSKNILNPMQAFETLGPKFDCDLTLHVYTIDKRTRMLLHARLWFSLQHVIAEVYRLVHPKLDPRLTDRSLGSTSYTVPYIRLP